MHVRFGLMLQPATQATLQDGWLIGPSAVLYGPVLPRWKLRSARGARDFIRFDFPLLGAGKTPNKRVMVFPGYWRFCLFSGSRFDHWRIWHVG